MVARWTSFFVLEQHGPLHSAKWQTWNYSNFAKSFTFVMRTNGSPVAITLTSLADIVNIKLMADELTVELDCFEGTIEANEMETFAVIADFCNSWKCVYITKVHTSCFVVRNFLFRAQGWSQRAIQKKLLVVRSVFRLWHCSAKTVTNRIFFDSWRIENLAGNTSWLLSVAYQGIHHGIMIFQLHVGISLFHRSFRNLLLAERVGLEFVRAQPLLYQV